jgi:hypothetical protein
VDTVGLVCRFHAMLCHWTYNILCCVMMSSLGACSWILYIDCVVLCA